MTTEEQRLDAAYARFGKVAWALHQLSEQTLVHHGKEPKGITFATTHEECAIIAAAWQAHQDATIDLRALVDRAKAIRDDWDAVLTELEANRWVSAVAGGEVR